MFTIRIAEPSSVAYPFSMEVYNDPLIVYHGTCSAYVENIEREGLRTNPPSFDRVGFETIIKAYEAVGLGNTDITLLKVYALGAKRDEATGRAIYLSQRFWHAHEYSNSMGGEAVNNALKAARNFLEFSTDGERRRRLIEIHLEEARNAEAQGRNYLAQKSRTQAGYLSNEEMLGGLMNGVETVEQELRNRVVNSHPVVYAVRIETDWFDNWESFDGKNGDCFADNDLSCQHPITADRLIAKVDYVNGLGDPNMGSSSLSHIWMDWERARSLPDIGR